MKRRIFGFGALASLAVAGCSTRSKFLTYNGPEVTSVVVNKGQRRLYLLNNEEILKAYDFDLGFTPTGHKQFEGDGKTPEGTYLIDRRNPRSKYHLSVGISYPNSKDIATAIAAGRRPGGEIFIHGQPNTKKAKGRDWTAGCIAVKNDEIEEIYAMVKDGTVITLRP
ncbi:L,D-transpeptidase family protein [Sedimentitalea todarodis]|uniref:L,D-transpeptidase family protein n=1 Tax=Sedimentitalea todarodis TaxID=1631240 RepID=A0ABU3VDI4_9RHOB|nr:L,D-transpeptidase family protein [Sedimentitalea todarodis]MDU9004245.1 L,D-transpeptidase family protein [Sedimentitalea todarodis]